MQKKEFTSFDVAAIVRELKETTMDSRVSNIYQSDSKTLIFKLHKPDKPTFGLVMEAGKRLHLTAYTVEKPAVPPAFCMALRKYLRNGYLTNIEQPEFERIVVFLFKTKMGILRLILELFGDGNFILVSEKCEILQALIYKRMRDRNILREEKFVFAPSSGKNPYNVSGAELQDGLRSFGDVEVVRALARFLSIGGIHAEEVLLRAGIDKTKSCNTLTTADFDAIFDSLHSLLSQASKDKLEPSIVLDESGKFIDVVPFKLKRYEGFPLKPLASFSEALDEFYVRVSAVEKAKAVTSVKVEELKREAERLKRIIVDQEKTLVDAEAKADRDRRIGDVIYAHVGELQELLDRFLNAKRNGKSWGQIVSEVLTEKKASVKPSMFFESFDAKSLIVEVRLDDLRFGLDFERSLYDSAGEFYIRGKRARQKLEGAKTALEETRKKLAEVEAKMRAAEALEHAAPTEVMEEVTKRKIKHKEWFERFRWFVSSDDFLVVAGKDAVSNEVLVKKHTEPNDIVFHADVVGAPFVVVKTEGKEPTEQCLREAGEFAAAFSRGWREGFGSVDVYWIKPDQLSKSGPSGEYVPHGGFVVSGKRNWIRNVPLRVAIGVAVNAEEGVIRIGGGPVDSVKTKTNVYVVVVPGDQNSKELLKQVLRMLVAKIPKEQRETILKASTEQIREFIPYNKGRAIQE
ncbi:fibronectin-binding domain-containing protein [Candidatus Bathyarchaeota archaeon]|nr:fibronectin-binding domain-containing protein [Candidatus Bathyarchaeota archaeon]